MATHTGGTSSPVDAPKKAEAAKLADDFQPNEPRPKTGVDDEGKPDDSLGESQAERAETEALLSLRPQPAAEEIKKVLEALRADKTKKFKSAKDAGSAAVDELNRMRAG
jgi:hypothetical protein